MARQKPSDKVATLLKQQADLAKQLKEAQAKAQAEAKETVRRKNELAGSVILKAVEAMPSGQVASIVHELLDAGLKRAADRALFDLPTSKKPNGGGSSDGGALPPAPPPAALGE